MDDLVRAAVSYADDAVQIAEELLDEWYEASQESIATGNKEPRQYEAEFRNLVLRHRRYKDRLVKLKDR